MVPQLWGFRRGRRHEFDMQCEFYKWYASDAERNAIGRLDLRRLERRVQRERELRCRHERGGERNRDVHAKFLRALGQRVRQRYANEQSFRYQLSVGMRCQLCKRHRRDTHRDAGSRLGDKRLGRRLQR